MNVDPSYSAEELEQLLRSDAYAEARRRVFVQLTEALLFEKLAAYETFPTAEDGKEEIVIAGQDERGEPVEYRCEGRNTASFGRIRLTDRPIVRVRQGRADKALDPAAFLEEVARAARPAPPPDRLAAFAQEIEQTLLKEATWLHWRAKATARQSAMGAAVRPSADDAEGDAGAGHPYHPCFKSRIGFSLADNAAYGPEFHPRLRLRWLAVRAEDVETTASASVPADGDWRAVVRADVGPASFASWEARLARLDLDPADYVFVPAHPWQWRERIVPLFHRELAAGRIVSLGEGEALYSPQQSIRTLANRSDPSKLSVKLALGIANTSSERTISPRHARNGPRVSDRLAAFVRDDAYLRDECRLVLLRERLGMSYRYERLPGPVRTAAAGALGALWRDSVHPYLEAGEEAMPHAALCQVRPDGRPYADDGIHKLGLAHWLDRVLDVTLRPILHLMYAHGVAVEAHGQNLTLIQRGGAPVRLAVRDFSGGVLFDNGTNANPEEWPETGRKTDVRDVVHNALFFVHLAELAHLLEREYQWPEERFWHAAAGAVRRYERDFPRLREAFAAYDLFAETVEVGLLASRRMRGEQGPRDHAVRNALHRERRMRHEPHAGRTPERSSTLSFRLTARANISSCGPSGRRAPSWR